MLIIVQSFNRGATINFQAKINKQRADYIKRTIRNALRGAAHPWTIEKCRQTFSIYKTRAERLEIFHKHIGSIFPQILDLVVSGHSIPSIEKTIGIDKGMLSKFLEARGVLKEKVLAARELRGRVGVGADDETPLPETNRGI